MDGSNARASFFRLCRQLSCRCEVRSDCRRRSLSRHPPGRGGRCPDDDRSDRETFWFEASTARCRYGVWSRAKPSLARQRKEDRAAYSSHRRGQAQSRHLLARDFTYDKARDVYTCPGGKLLTTTGRIRDDDLRLYTASKRDCDVCPLKSQCCPKDISRKLLRSVYEESRDVARGIAHTSAFEQSRRDWKRSEMLFAHLKRIVRLGRLRLRGPWGARFELILAAIAQNLRRLAKLTARPPPTADACLA